MRLLIGVVIAAVVAIGLGVGLNGFGLSDDFSLANDDVVSVSGDNTQMNTAIARARETLPMFWTVHDAPGPEHSQLSLKVRISDGVNTEHFWLGNVERENGSLIGTINNDPKSVSTVKLHERYTFSSDDISDWMYMKNDRIFGGFTIRVLLDKIPKEEADGLRAILAFEPK